jgi:hypothetical protein
MAQRETFLEIGLAAAVVTVRRDQPQILLASPDAQAVPGLPFGSFDPLSHRTLDIGLRAFVSAQSGLKLGYVEQLYTFGDRGRHARAGDEAPHVLSIGYLALTLMEHDPEGLPPGAGFQPWYRYFPWEDWRAGPPRSLDALLPELERWAADKEDEGREERGRARALSRAERLRLWFAERWDEEKVLERYELLYEAGLLEEARRDGREAALARTAIPKLGEPMRFDHRRILATAMGRLRAKLKYRPLVFELLPAVFTLTQLQRTVEAISGRHLHQQNFRRVVENAALVEPTGEQALTRGRPAALFRFRGDVLRERPAPGLKLGARGRVTAPSRD